MSDTRVLVQNLVALKYFFDKVPEFILLTVLGMQIENCSTHTVIFFKKSVMVNIAVLRSNLDIVYW